MVWRDRASRVRRSSASAAALLILDEDGTLALATPNDTGLMIQAKAAVLTGRAWTAPTLSGTTLYLRDLKQIVALELGNSQLGARGSGSGWVGSGLGSARG